MNKKGRGLNQLLTILGVVVVLCIAVPSRVGAQGIVEGDNLPVGTRITGDAVFQGETVRIDGDVDGDVLAIGNKVEINGQVSGSLLILAQKIAINGEVGGTTYATAVELDLKPMASLSRNLYFAGLSLSTQENAQIRRDLYTAAMGAQMRGSVGGDIHAIIGPAEFFYLIMGKIARTDWLGSNKPIETDTNTQSYDVGPAAKESRVVFAGLAPALINLESISFEQAAGVDWKLVENWLLNRLREWFVLLVLGLVVLWGRREWIPGSAGLLQSNPIRSLGWGLLGVVVSINLIGVAILLLILLLATGFFLGIITLWELAWPFMAIGGFSLGLVFTIFALFVAYISKAIVAFLVGGMVLKLISPRYAGFSALALIIGLFFYVLLAAIPVLGLVIATIVTALGLGAAWLFYRDRINQVKLSELEFAA